MLEDNDDVPQLTAETFAALQEFYKEEEKKQKNQDSVKFQENWVKQQFYKILYFKKLLAAIKSVLV